MKPILWISWIVAALAFAGNASAQEEASENGWEGRVFLNFNAGFQTVSPSFAYTHSTVLFEEGATAGLSIPGESGPSFDIAGGVRLVQNLGVGVTYSRYNNERTAELSATIPHPFFYGEPGVAQRQIPLSRKEDVLHIQGIYRIPVTGKLQLGIFGGPSYFRCKDDLVRQFQLQGEIAQDLDWSVEIADYTLKVEKDTAWGFNGGGDVFYLFTRYLGVGGTVRYSWASHQTVNDFADTADLVEDGVWGGTGTVASEAMDHGGLQILGGVSFRF